ncbi:RNA polymerase sigma factor [Streptomyces sp. NPDC087903]|uniref:RNA polymerase sigma factor n=1 Tax=Streptomyces sp. NPDC087903 TaxID=3365819 RepID=UPI003821C1B0
MADTKPTQSVNTAALAAVFRKDAPQMTALAARLLREADIPECMVGAEDLVQTAFEKALCIQDVVEEPRAYIYVSLRREVNHWAQRMHKERDWEAKRLANLRTSALNGRDIGELVADRLTVLDVVRRLPEQQRAVVAAKMYGFSQHETALLTKRHPGTVAVHIARAVVKLAYYLAPVILICVSVWSRNWWGLLVPSVALYVMYRNMTMPMGRPPEEARVKLLETDEPPEKRRTAC